MERDLEAFSERNWGACLVKGLLGVVHYALFPDACAGDWKGFGQTGQPEVLGEVLGAPVRPASWDPAASLDLVLEDDAFGAIELTWIRDRDIRLSVARKLRESDIQVMFSGGPPFPGTGLSLSDVEEAGRRQAVLFANSLVDMACELGGRNLLVPSGPDPGEALRPAALQALIRSLNEVCEYARKGRPEMPVVVCLEPFDRDVDCRQLVGSTRLAAEVIGEVRESSGNCGITLDMSHVAQLGEDMAQAIGDAGDFLVHAHIANCVLDPASPLYGDKHPPFGVPGGVYTLDDAARYLDLLDRSGYFARPCLYGSPVVSIEVRPGETDPAQILKEFKEHVGSQFMAR